MQLHLIQDCSTSHVIDKIELHLGHTITSCLTTAAGDTAQGSVLDEPHGRRESSTSYEVIEDLSANVDDGDFGIWFLLRVLDWVSVNCSNKQIEWCFLNKVSSSVQYLDEEEYNLNLEELFEQSQRFIYHLSDSRITAQEKHGFLEQLLFSQILPKVIISQQEMHLLGQALAVQERCIDTLNIQLEELNNTSTACKSTLANLRDKLLPDLLKHAQLRALYPAGTLAVIRRLDIDANKLKRGVQTEDSQAELSKINGYLKQLQKKTKKSISSGWKRKHNELLDEQGPVLDMYIDTEANLEAVRQMGQSVMKAKVKATQVREELRNVQHRLESETRTYGYDIPSGHGSNMSTNSHVSLYDAIYSIAQDVSEEVGHRHALECNWIIEKCGLTKLEWTEDPRLIPSVTDIIHFDTIEEDFVLLAEPDVFTLILDKISTQCVFTVGRLFKLLPRIQQSPSSTKRLILTYETILYGRVTEYILPLFELRYSGVLDRLTKEIVLLSWQELDVQEEWLVKLLSTPSQVDQKPPVSPVLSPAEAVAGLWDTYPHAGGLQLNAGTSPMKPFTVFKPDHPEEQTIQATSASGSEQNTSTPAEQQVSESTEVTPTRTCTSPLSDSTPDTPTPRCRCQSDSGYHEMKHSDSDEGSLVAINNPKTCECVDDFANDLTESKESANNGEKVNNKFEPSEENPTMDTLLPNVPVTNSSSAGSARSTLKLQLQHTTLDRAPTSLNVDNSSTSESFHSAVSSLNYQSANSTLADGTLPPTENSAEPGKDLHGVSAELDQLMDLALATLNDEDDPSARPSRRSSTKDNTGGAGRRHSLETTDAVIPPIKNKNIGFKKTRSKSVGAKSKVRWNKSKDGDKRLDVHEQTSPSSPSSSPRHRMVQQKTRREVESVLLKRRSRLRESRKTRSSACPSQPTSSIQTGSNQFTEQFKDSINCLSGMRLLHSPLEKAQMLAKCLRFMSDTISEVRTRTSCPTTSDDLVTVAIVLLINIAQQNPQEFRSIYIQLKFISTYMNEFMDAGIHNFATVQFIGAMHFIQDQILTKRHRLSQAPDESNC